VSSRVAVVQATPVYLDRQGSLEVVVERIREAAGLGARLVVLPESFVPGFPYWPRAYPLPERGRSLDALQRLRDNAIRLHRDDLAGVQEVVRSARVTAVLGVTELGEHPALLYNSMITIGPDGDIRQVHRKLQLTFDERCVWSAGDAQGLDVLETEAGAVGGLICGNNSMTLAKATLLLGGEQIHCALWPGYTWMQPTVDIVSRGYAVEGRVFVLVAASFLPAAAVPSDAPFREETAWTVAGGSGIVAPDGRWLAGPALGEEAILTADIDVAELSRYRAVRDAVDDYGRPDLFRLHVNRAPMRTRDTRLEEDLSEDWRVYR
jgi:nitrilase